MVVKQGDIYWIYLDQPIGSAPGYLHPHVVVQNDSFNRSAIRTVVVCALTSKTKRAADLGNVLLNEGEGGLPKQSVVNVSQLTTVDQSQLGEKIGQLSTARMSQVLDGIYLLLEPRSTY